MIECKNLDDGVKFYRNAFGYQLNKRIYAESGNFIFV